MSKPTRNVSVTLTPKAEERIRWLVVELDMPNVSQVVRTAIDELYKRRGGPVQAG